jgi:hypothetical protein
MVVLRDTASRFRRKAIDAINSPCNVAGSRHELRGEIYLMEADRLDDLISLCDGTATANASADTLPVAAETIDATADTLPLMPRSGLTPQR